MTGRPESKKKRERGERKSRLSSVIFFPFSVAPLDFRSILIHATPFRSPPLLIFFPSPLWGKKGALNVAELGDRHTLEWLLWCLNGPSRRGLSKTPREGTYFSREPSSPPGGVENWPGRPPHRSSYNGAFWRAWRAWIARPEIARSAPLRNSLKYNKEAFEVYWNPSSSSFESTEQSTDLRNY